MRTSFSLSAEQVDQAISWKKKHLDRCKSELMANFTIMFPEHNSQEKVAYIQCMSCKQWGLLMEDRDGSLNNEELSKKVKERLFQGMIFMGAGAHSGVMVDLLHRRVDYAISMLSGEQQNGGMGTEYNEKFANEAIESIDAVILDLITALGAQDRFSKL